jgi:hypothetical protein
MLQMSMITEYLRLRAHELAHLRLLLAEDPDEACEYAGDLRMGDLDEPVSSRGMDTDKAWAGLQYLLTKAESPVDVIGGGEPITNDEWGYDPPRLLKIEDVRSASRFFDQTPFAALARHFSVPDLDAADVYPGIWHEEWALSYLEDCYVRLAELFRAAAADGEPILVWLD